MIAVFVNCGAIILGSIIGLVFAKKISEEFSTVIQTAAGLVTVVIGIQSAFLYKSIVILSLSLIIGGLLGSWWNWEGKILALGDMLQNLVEKKDSTTTVDKELKKNNWNFAYAFLNSSVLFCVGSMAILGSFQAGIEKNYTLIFTKSILDGFMAITFAAAMGPGTIFSSIMILIYQGSLTLLSTLIKPFVDEILLAELSGTGGILIMMIGLNLLKIKSIKTANFLPSIILVILFVFLKKQFM